MEKITIYHVRVEGRAVSRSWTATFIEEPTLTRMESAIITEIEDLQAECVEHLDDQARDFCVLLQVIRHALSTDEKTGVIEAAGTLIGQIVVTEQEAFTDCTA